MHKFLATFIKKKSLKIVTLGSVPLSKPKQFCCHYQTDKQNTGSTEGEYITIN